MPMPSPGKTATCLLIHVPDDLCIKPRKTAGGIIRYLFPSFALSCNSGIISSSINSNVYVSFNKITLAKAQRPLRTSKICNVITRTPQRTLRLREIKTVFIFSLRRRAHQEILTLCRFFNPQTPLRTLRPGEI
jgi:hypothetical protein